MPENADRFVRLETIANILATLPHEQSHPIATRHRLSQICNSAPVANSFVTTLEDPFETLFTESFTFFGGSFLVFPGNDLAASIQPGVISERPLFATLAKATSRLPAGGLRSRLGDSLH